MSEQEVVTLPEDATEGDVRRVKETARIVRRNVRIRRQYPELRDEVGRDEAFRRLARKHCCSVSTVREVVYGRAYG
jgi:hypothetical protein